MERAMRSSFSSAILLILPGCIWISDAEVCEKTGTCASNQPDARDTDETGKPIDTDEPSVFQTYYRDADEDGFGNPLESSELADPQDGWTLDNSDCDDTNAAINPGATEVCGDLIDEDCSGTPVEVCAPSGEIDMSATDVPPHLSIRSTYGDGFGTSLAVGDLNGDGTPDLVVGNYSVDGYTGALDFLPGPFESRASAWTPTETDKYRVNGEAPGHHFSNGSYGQAVLPIVPDATGTPHVLVSAYDATNALGDANAGAIYAVSWPDLHTSSVADQVRLVEGEGGDRVGYQGFTWITGWDTPILAIGSLPSDVADTRSNKVVLITDPFAGTLPHGVSEGIALEGWSRGGWDQGMGAAMDSCDMDGDGRDELMVGASGSVVRPTPGAVYAFTGPFDSTTFANDAFYGFRATEEDEAGYLGDSLSCTGDVDGDGLPDLAVSAHGWPTDTAPASRGAIYLFLSSSGTPAGNVDTLSEASTILTSTGTLGMSMGRDLSLDADLDQDGYSDLLFTFYGYRSVVGQGAVALRYGGPTFTGTHAVAETTDLDAVVFDSDSIIGANLHFTGNHDLNADGHPDLAFINSTSDWETTRGGAFLFFWGPRP